MDNHRGRLVYFLRPLTNLFGTLCTPTGSPVLDITGGAKKSGLTTSAELHPNPSPLGRTHVRLSVARPERVMIRIQDLAGRTVRILTDQYFATGSRELTWDGLDDHGQRVRPGVYFVRACSASGRLDSATKVVVLR